MKKVIYRHQISRLFGISFALLLLFSSQLFGQGDPVKGKQLFNTNCAACHRLDRDMTGPALGGIEEKRDNEWLQKWIKNSAGLIKSGDADAIAIFEEWNKVPMTAFPLLSDQDVNDILAYTSNPPVVEAPKEDAVAEVKEESGLPNEIILGALILIFAMLLLMLNMVNKVLRRIAAANGVDVSEEVKHANLWQAFVRNQFLVLVSVILLLLASAYFVFGYLMQIGIDQGYEPIQPIHYSHKIHAGDNEIDCKFCHSSARTSKSAGIPSLNVCMNCHKSIMEYTGEEDLANGYTKEFYTGEIQKLYDAVGWDAVNQKYTGETKPVEWVRIHNLPDFVYFNHSQHVSVAGIECQTCHGPVEEMEIMSQHASLSMGWCVNCHRETEVKVADNGYYEKIHEELSKKYGVEKLTAAQMGGLECGKCHY